MTNITTIGLDLAKMIFQVHGTDEDGRPVVRKMSVIKCNGSRNDLSQEKVLLIWFDTLGGILAVLQAPCFDGLLFDPFSVY